MAKFISIAEYAKLHGVAPVTVRQKCVRGKINGAIKIGEGRRATWCIPEDAEYIDSRVKSGNYIGARHRNTPKDSSERPEE